MEGEGYERWASPAPMPGAPPADWPAPPAGGPSPEARPRRRGRWVAALAAVVVVVGAAAAGAVVLLGDERDDEAYCDALDTRARVDLRVIVFLHEDVGPNGVARIEGDIRDLPGVEDLVYVDRDEAYAEALELFADEPNMQELLRPEDVPTSFRFTVPDGNAVVDVRQALADDVWVTNIADPPYDGRSVLEIVRMVIDEDMEGDLGRFGPWVAPDVAERLGATAPEAVADDVDRLLEELTDDEGVIETAHQGAAEAVVDDARERCR